MEDSSKSIKQWWEVLRDAIAKLFPAAGGSTAVPAWDKCTKASCWNGANASQRMMNILSPGMSDAKFQSYLDWQLARGCNTVHVFLANRRDGENAGYCIYGNEWGWRVNDAFVSVFRDRIARIRKAKMAYVPWLFADDSAPFCAAAKQNFPKYLSDLSTAGLLEQASIVVAGLEMNEPGSFSLSETSALVNSIRAVYKGKVGTHQTSGRFDYAVHADICFYQVEPGKSAAFIQSEAARVKKLVGKPLNFFELARQPAPDLCAAAMRGGAYAVGNI